MWQDNVVEKSFTVEGFIIWDNKRSNYISGDKPGFPNIYSTTGRANCRISIEKRRAATARKRWPLIAENYPDPNLSIRKVRILFDD